MIFDDNRGFIEALRRSGDLVEVEKEVSWDLELGAVSRLACEKDGPAVWFKRVTDYVDEVSVFVNPVATWRRIAIALGLEPTATVREIYEAYEKGEANPIDPVEVTEAPCKQVVRSGADANLFDLPTPMLHEGDGGRYLGTWDLVISRDVDSGWVNWGMYRFMVYDAHHLTGFPRPTSHLGKVFQEHYVARGKPMPLAIAIGTDPLSHFAAAATYALGGDEASLAGGLRGKRRVEGVEPIGVGDSEISAPDGCGLHGQTTRVKSNVSLMDWRSQSCSSLAIRSSMVRPL